MLGHSPLLWLFGFSNVPCFPSSQPPAGCPTHRPPHIIWVILCCWVHSPGKSLGFLSLLPPAVNHSDERWDRDFTWASVECSAIRGSREGKLKPPPQTGQPVMEDDLDGTQRLVSGAAIWEVRWQKVWNLWCHAGNFHLPRST